MTRMATAAARILKASFASDSIAVMFTIEAMGSSFAANLQIEAAPQDDLSLMSTPLRHDRINGAVLASEIAHPLSVDDTFLVGSVGPYAGEWSIDTVPRTVSDDDPFGLLVRFEACRA
jgi:hypothetical protein